MYKLFLLSKVSEIGNESFNSRFSNPFAKSAKLVQRDSGKTGRSQRTVKILSPTQEVMAALNKKISSLLVFDVGPLVVFSMIPRQAANQDVAAEPPQLR